MKRKIIYGVLMLGLLLIAAKIIYSYTAGNDTPVYQMAMIERGDIESTISGSGAQSDRCPALRIKDRQPVLRVQNVNAVGFVERFHPDQAARVQIAVDNVYFTGQDDGNIIVTFYSAQR